MTEEHQSEQTRRTFVKGAAAAGVAATGITAFSGNAAAQPNISVSDVTGEEYEVEDSEIGIQQGNRNAQFQNIDIEITDIDEAAETVSGTVSGTVLPNANANQNAAKDFDVDFTDAAVSVLDPDYGSQLVLLEIPDLFLNVLGLLVSLDLELVVEADEDGGLLGQLLAGLGA